MPAGCQVSGEVGVGHDLAELNQVRADSKRVADDLTCVIQTAYGPIFGIERRAS